MPSNCLSVPVVLMDPGALGSGREGPWVRAPSQEGALSAKTRSRDQVVVHLRSKITSAQAERLSHSGILTYFRRDRWSGRQDLNLRPPGPERLSGSCDGIALPGTASHRHDITADLDPAHPLNGSRDTPCEAGFVPTVSPPRRAKLILPERLLSVREAAERLSISRASLYKLCAQNQVAYVRVGNAIRFALADLDAFLRAHRRPQA